MKTAGEIFALPGARDRVSYQRKIRSIAGAEPRDFPGRTTAKSKGKKLPEASLGRIGRIKNIRWARPASRSLFFLGGQPVIIQKNLGLSLPRPKNSERSEQTRVLEFFVPFKKWRPTRKI